MAERRKALELQALCRRTRGVMVLSVGGTFWEVGVRQRSRNLFSRCSLPATATIGPTSFESSTRALLWATLPEKGLASAPEKLFGAYCLGAERQRPLPHRGPQVVVRQPLVSLELLPAETQAKGEAVQLLEGGVRDHVTPVSRRVAPKPVDQDHDRTASPAGESLLGRTPCTRRSGATAAAARRLTGYLRAPTPCLSRRSSRIPLPCSGRYPRT